jgi:hypothetical protein
MGALASETSLPSRIAAPSTNLRSTVTFLVATQRTPSRLRRHSSFSAKQRRKTARTACASTPRASGAFRDNFDGVRGIDCVSFSHTLENRRVSPSAEAPTERRYQPARGARGRKNSCLARHARRKVQHGFASPQGGSRPTSGPWTQSHCCCWRYSSSWRGSRFERKPIRPGCEPTPPPAHSRWPPRTAASSRRE